MPIYEYKCDSCGHQFEKLQKISDEVIRVCPECGTESVRKLVSAPGFRLKGGGWYETDFKTGAKRNVAESGGKKIGSEGKSTESSEKTKKTAKKQDTK